MNHKNIANDLLELFKDDIISLWNKSDKRLYVEIKPESLLKIVEYVFVKQGARFNIASGTDCRDHFEILYHFCFDEIDLVASFRVKLAKNNPQIASLANLTKSANWIEREMNELLGINFINHPDMRRLLLADDWPNGVYPLRQDYKEWDKDAIRDRGV